MNNDSIQFSRRPARPCCICGQLTHDRFTGLASLFHAMELGNAGCGGDLDWTMEFSLCSAHWPEQTKALRMQIMNSPDTRRKVESKKAELSEKRAAL